MPYNLEPIEDHDMDLAARFGATAENASSPDATPHGQSSPRTPEKVVRTEGALERGSAQKDSAYQRVLQSVQNSKGQQVPPTDTLAQDASDVHQKTNRDSQVQHLLDLALIKGVQHAIKVAQHTDDYYILDRVHDQLLLDDFRNALKERGLLKETKQ